MTDLEEESANFIKLVKILIETIPKNLKTLFVTSWNEKYPRDKWRNNRDSREVLVIEMPYSVKGSIEKVNCSLINRIKNGGVGSWDPSVLFFIFLHAKLRLTDACRPQNERGQPLNISESIDRLFVIRSLLFSKIPLKSVSTAEFEDMAGEIITISRDLFGDVAVDEISQIMHSEITSSMLQGIQSELKVQIEVHNEYSRFLEQQPRNEENNVGMHAKVCLHNLFSCFCKSLFEVYTYNFR